MFDSLRGIAPIAGRMSAYLSYRDFDSLIRDAVTFQRPELLVRIKSK